MISRALTVTLTSALLVGAYAGCSDGGGTGEGTIGGYHTGGGNPATGSSGGSSGGTTGGSSGSSSGGTASSSSGSSGGTASSSSGSSSGGTSSEAGAPLTLEEAITQLASCVSYTDFTAQTSNGYSASDIAKAQTTQYGDCNACHNAGDGGFWASYGTVQGVNMTETMFNNTFNNPTGLYIYKWVTGTVDANGNFKTLAPSNDIANQSALANQCMAGTPCHPKFQLSPDVVTAINTFVTTSITNWQNHTCTGGGPVDAGGGG
jgi:hypothetical protein